MTAKTQLTTEERVKVIETTLSNVRMIVQEDIKSGAYNKEIFFDLLEQDLFSSKKQKWFYLIELKDATAFSHKFGIIQTEIIYKDIMQSLTAKLVADDDCDCGLYSFRVLMVLSPKEISKELIKFIDDTIKTQYDPKNEVGIAIGGCETMIDDSLASMLGRANYALYKSSVNMAKVVLIKQSEDESTMAT